MQQSKNPTTVYLYYLLWILGYIPAYPTGEQRRQPPYPEETEIGVLYKELKKHITPYPHTLWGAIKWRCRSFFSKETDYIFMGCFMFEKQSGLWTFISYGDHGDRTNRLIKEISNRCKCNLKTKTEGKTRRIFDSTNIKTLFEE